MVRRLRKGSIGERTALPPLFGKQVDIVNMKPATALDVEGSSANIWIVRLIINERPYRITMWGQDQFAVMQRLIKMQSKRPRNHS